MPRYRLNKEVPWGDVLDTLRWGITRRTIQYKSSFNYLRKTHSDLELLSVERNLLKYSLFSYQALRSFLGYATVTQLEKKTLRLLELSLK